MSEKLNRKRGKEPEVVITDTSPLLLLLVGMYDQRLIGKFKRVRKYTTTDYEFLFQFLERKKVLVTPQILAEVSNLTMGLKEKRFSEFIEKNKENLKRVKEKYIAKDEIIETKELLRFGFTDVSIILAAKEQKAMILTEDYPLYNRCKKEGLKVKHLQEIMTLKEIFTT